MRSVTPSSSALQRRPMRQTACMAPSKLLSQSTPHRSTPHVLLKAPSKLLFQAQAPRSTPPAISRAHSMISTTAAATHGRLVTAPRAVSAQGVQGKRVGVSSGLLVAPSRRVSRRSHSRVQAAVEDATAIRDQGYKVHDAATGASSTPSSQPLFGEGSKGRVVVIGAGLVGVLAASLFAKKGYQVAVFEKREGGPPKVARSYPILVNWRAVKALATAGLDPSIITKYPVCGGFTTLGAKMPGLPPWIKIYLVDRIAFGLQLVAAAQEKYPKEISFHFSHEISELDTVKRTVKVAATQDGVPALGVNEVPYDLLVAADGNYSQTRRLLQQHDPDLKVDIAMTSVLPYFSFHNLPTPAHLPWTVDQEGSENDAYIRTSQPDGPNAPGLYFWKTPNGGFSGLGVLPLVCKDVPAWVSDLVAKRTTPSNDQVTQIKALLDRSLQLVPKEWHEPIVQQIPAAKFSVMGRSVWCNKVHFPGVLLVGDAAHGMTSGVGQGANLGMEDVTVLDRILDEVASTSGEGAAGGATAQSSFPAADVQLDAVSAEFERRRLADIRAAQTLDLLDAVRRKHPVDKEFATLRERLMFGWQSFAYNVSMIVGGILSLVAPGQQVFLPCWYVVQLPISYRQGFDRFQVQVGVVLTFIVALLGWWLSGLVIPAA